LRNLINRVTKVIVGIFSVCWRSSETDEAPVSYLNRPTTVYKRIGRFQSSMVFEVTPMQVVHSLN